MTDQLFILGSPRSGTSTLQYSLKHYFGFEGDTEGHITNLTYKLIRAAAEHYNDYSSGICFEGANTISKVGKARLEDTITSALLSLIAPATGRRWCDKTPGFEAILLAPRILKALPQAKFMHIIRNGADNVASRMRKFPGIPFETHCFQWTQDNIAWLRVKEELPRKAFIEFRFDELENPPLMLQKIANFLGAELCQEPPEVLPIIEQTTGLGHPEFWTTKRQNLFNSICYETMKAFNFEFDTLYEDKPGDITLPPPIFGTNISRICMNQDYIACEPRQNGVWIFLHPALANERKTALKYNNIKLIDVHHFRAKIRLEGELSAPVAFTLEIFEPGGDHCIFSASETVDVGEEKSWLVSGLELDGFFDVQISTAMANPEATNHCSWAWLLSPTFFAN